MGRTPLRYGKDLGTVNGKRASEEADQDVQGRDRRDAGGRVPEGFVGLRPQMPQRAGRAVPTSSYPSESSTSNP